MDQTVLGHIFIITLISGIAYSPNLFGVPMLFDSWIYGRWIHEGKLEHLSKFYQVVGMPQFGYEISKIGKNKNSYRLRLGILIYFTKIFQYISIYVIASQNFQIGAQTALALTILVSLYPSNTFAQEFICGLQYGLSWSIYTISIALIFNLSKENPIINIIIILFATLLMIFSFSMKSLLFYSPILFAFSMIFRINILTSTKWDYVFKITMILLPFLYWLLNEKLFPRRDSYNKYNEFISASDLPRAIIRLIQGTADATIGGLFEVIKLLRNRVVLFSIFFAAAFESRENIDLSLEFNSINLLFVGTTITFITLIPYVLVNQDFDSRGYLTKNFIMCDVPFALVLFAMIKMFIPQSWQSEVIFLIVFLLILYKLFSQLELWLQFSKHITIKVKVDSLKKSSDLVFYIEDLTTKNLGGKKDKIYPMTFYFLTNSVISEHQYYGVDARYNSKKNLKEKCVVEFDSLPLPFIKRKFLPKEIIGVRIRDGAISYKLLLRFMVFQIRRDPFNLDESNDLFQVEIFEVL